MNRFVKFLNFLWIALLFLSCEGNQKQATKVVKKSEFSTNQKHAIKESIQGNASKKIDDWQEYETVKGFLEQYKSISPNEALNNSKELNDLVKSMKDSVKPDFLESNSFNARVNLLHNETLRLYDMSAISSIKFTEVNEQVTKVMNAFSSVNSKINTLVKQAELDAQVNDPNFRRMSKDSLNKENIEALNVIETNEMVKRRKALYEQQQKAINKKGKPKAVKPKKINRDNVKTLKNVKKKNN